MTLARRMFSCFAVLLIVGVVLAADVKEPRTGISFPDKLKGSKLSKLGVRTKGPLKVYAVGQYDKSFMLKMNMGVGAQKMSNALVDALKPRCKGCSSAIDEFEALLLDGLPDGASKGTKLLFGTKGGKITVTINDKTIGKVSSKPLATAFQGIYTDKNAVCKLKPVEEGDEDSTDEGLFFGILNDSQTVITIGIVSVTTLLLFLLRKSNANKS